MDADFKKWLLWNAGGAAAGAVILIIFLLLLGNDLSRRVSLIQTERQQLAARLQSIESLISLRSGSDRAAKQQAILEKALPNKDQLIGFSKELEQLAKSNQLGFGFSFESETAGTETAPGKNNFTMTLGGSYPNVIRFLKATENSKYYITLNLVEINLKEKEYQTVMKGQVFSQ